ncbi:MULTISPECIES: CoA-binding protein [unclassified Helicobacter]|uniref:CoA-binding protein n=1 Tax=unclassified Helicobacter TaxID=2593540 RepID=UPI000CF0F804|nr:MULTISPECIES: CoA-binding protein [unclassified Helicobacter]
MYEKLKELKNIAINGLSPNPLKDSFMVSKFLQDKGFEIIPIYPKEDFILGQKVYRSYTQAHKEHQIDCVVVFRKSEKCLEIAEEILKSSPLPKVVFLQLGITNQQARQILEAKGIFFIENRCIKTELEILGI